MPDSSDQCAADTLFLFNDGLRLATHGSVQKLAATAAGLFPRGETHQESVEKDQGPE